MRSVNLISPITKLLVIDLENKMAEFVVFAVYNRSVKFCVHSYVLHNFSVTEPIYIVYDLIAACFK